MRIAFLMCALALTGCESNETTSGVSAADPTYGDGDPMLDVDVTPLETRNFTLSGAYAGYALTDAQPQSIEGWTDRWFGVIEVTSRTPKGVVMVRLETDGTPDSVLVPGRRYRVSPEEWSAPVHLVALAGPDNFDWVYEESADILDVRVEALGGDRQRVHFEAGFERVRDGETVIETLKGSVDLELPTSNPGRS